MTKIKKSYLVLILTIAYVLLPTFFYAQTKSTEVKTINGKKYYIHTVEKGQSLYAIAKIYNMDVNSILAENDEAIDGLKPGQKLNIPAESLMLKNSTSIDTLKYVYHKVTKGETVYSITKKYNIDEKKLAFYNPTLINGLKEGNYLIVSEKNKAKPVPVVHHVPATESYTVLSGETLYGISKKLNISQESLLKLNPELKEGVKRGQVIKTISKVLAVAPTASVAVTPSVVDTLIVHKPKKTTYTLGLFLPFKLSESETINIDDLARAKLSFPQTQSLALDFYAGVKKAVDSLTSKDFEVTIRLFDTDDRDSSKIEGICKSEEFKNLDVIFGPLYAGIFKIVSRYARASNIPIVSPVIQQNKILFDNPLSSKVTPSMYTLIEGLAEYGLDSLANATIIIVNSTAKDQAYIKTFKARFNESLLKHNRTLKDSVIEVKGADGVKNAYVSGKKNVVVLLTNSQVYLQDFITQLYVFSDKKDIVLMGFSSVCSIDNLDQDYLNGLQFHFASADGVDFKDSIIRNLARPYQDYNLVDPSDIYFNAFDIAMYYLSHLKTVGPDFFLKLDEYNWSGVSMDFKFYRPDNETGFENRALYIYRYSNYKLQRSGWK